MKKILIVFFLAFFPMIAEEPFSEESLTGYDTTLLFPIDWSKKDHINLAISIPKGYKSIQPISLWDKAELIEFIPEDEDPENWSKIITIQKLVNRRISANQITQKLRENLVKGVNAKVLSKENLNEGYEEATFIAKYSYNGKDEILGVKYLSGPYDSVGAQMTIRLNEEMSEEDAVSEINEFFDENLNVMEDEAN